ARVCSHPAAECLSPVPSSLSPPRRHVSRDLLSFPTRRSSDLTLRRGGLKVSLTEWMSLMEALDKGLHRSSFTGFYYLCRCLLVKSEARSEEHTSELQSRFDLVCRLLLEKKKPRRTPGRSRRRKGRSGSSNESAEHTACI